jgi:phosphatidylglycerophosphatase C
LATWLGTSFKAWALLRCLPWLAGHALKLVPNHVAKARLLRLILAGVGLKTINAWNERWLASCLPAQLQPWTLERLAWHRQSGHCCVLVSASPDIYLAPVAVQLQFDGLLCTRMEVRNGRLTGEMASPNCHGEQKVVRLKAWLADRFGPDIQRDLTLYAYGDSRGDLPMLDMATRAFYRGAPLERRSARD